MPKNQDDVSVKVKAATARSIDTNIVVKDRLAKAEATKAKAIKTLTRTNMASVWEGAKA